MTDDGVAIVGSGSGPAEWLGALDGLDEGLRSVESHIRELESRAPRPGEISGLRGGLRGLEGGLDGVRGLAGRWAQSDAERRIVRERLGATQRQVRELQRRLDACARDCRD